MKKGTRFSTKTAIPSSPATILLWLRVPKRKGHEVYIRQGCAQCHSQVIRSDQATTDAYKRDWGSAPESPIPVRTRPTNPLDYMLEDLPSIGVRRHGGDLSNLAYRFQNRTALHLVLYDSRVARPESSMPPYRFLYDCRKIEGSPSDRALPLVGDLAPEEGYEIVPSDDAEALVDYLLALKKDYRDPREPAPTSAAAAEDVAAAAN